MTRKPLALSAALIALLATPAAAEWPITGAPPEPIPQDPFAASVVPYWGAPQAATPVDPGELPPQHPFMAPNGRSNLHNDAYQSDAYETAGPLGVSPRVSSTWLDHECASITFDSKGRIVTVCVGLERPVLMLMDPQTLATLATFDLPPRKASTLATAFQSFGGGGYFYLDNNDNAVVPTTDGHIDVIGENGDSFVLLHSYDVSNVVGSSSIESALPDWSGRLWFVTDSGIVGFVDMATGTVQSLNTHESIGNSFAVDETGGVYVVTDGALYRFDAVNGAPALTWRAVYPNIGVQKPGQTEKGSGTTPTIIKHSGVNYVAITDNADPMDVIVYRADTGAQVCSTPVFNKGASATDNSLIAWGNSLVVENNYGYTGVVDRSTGSAPITTPGVSRIDINFDTNACNVVWTTNVRVPTSVSKADTANGLVYVYEHPATSDFAYESSPGPLGPEDAWYLTALDINSGAVVWRALTGTGVGYNNNWAAITVGPTGAIYIGTLGGMVQVRDSA